MNKIGVFDSGIGGKSVAVALQKALPREKILCVDDSEHIPYGTKSPDEIFGYVCPKLELLIDDGCDLIVIACNTVTTTLISSIRQKYPDVQFIGIEPMVKPAALLTRSGIIAVCATPATLASDRYRWLKEKYASNITVLEPDCSGWATMVENNSIDRNDVTATINDLCKSGADVIVLGCTHYHWIEEIVRAAAGNRAHILQPEQAIVNRTKELRATKKI